MGFVGGVFGIGTRTDRRARVCPVLRASGSENGDESVDSILMIDEVVSSFKSMVEVRDRSYMLRMYRNCFVGSDAVDILVKKGLVTNRRDAVKLCQMMLSEGVFHHVLREHQFEDAKLFYQFTEGHGEKLVRVGWMSSEPPISTFLHHLTACFPFWLLPLSLRHDVEINGSIRLPKKTFLQSCEQRRRKSTFLFNPLCPSLRKPRR